MKQPKLILIKRWKTERTEWKEKYEQGESERGELKAKLEAAERAVLRIWNRETAKEKDKNREMDGKQRRTLVSASVFLWMFQNGENGCV